MASIYDILRANFPTLEDDDLDQLAQATRICIYPPKTILCHQGEIEDVFYILVEGQVDTFQYVAERYYFLGRMSPPSCFGEFALLVDQPRTADIVALTEIKTLEMNRKEFNQHIHSNPEIILAITRKMIERILQQEQQFMPRRIQTFPAEILSLFVSYSRKDEAFALKLIRDLQRYQYHVWMDRLNIVPGTEWLNSILRGLEETSIMVLILSPDSVVSDYVRIEWDYYLRENKVIIPILHQPCTFPAPLQALQYIDFTQMEYEFAVAYLVQALQTHGQAIAG